VPNRSVARERAAFGVIKGLSLLTIAILGLIMGFILYKGLRFSNEVRGVVMPYAERSPDGLALVVNREIDLPSIDFPMLYGMYTDEYINWSKISADDFDLLPVAIDPSAPDGMAVEKFLFGEAGRAAAGGQLGGLVKTVPDAAAALALVRSTPGAAALVPASLVGEGTAELGGIRAVPIRRLVLAVNEEVVALVDNRSIEDLDDALVEKLIAGAIGNWKEIGGPDLPVELYAPREGTALGAAVKAAGYQARMSSQARLAPGAGYAQVLAGRSGAAGFLFASEAQASGLSTLTRKGVEQGWNLTWQYLVEAPRLSGKVGGISTIIVNTLFMLLLTVLIAAPIGVAAAVYLVEYAKQGFLVRLLRLGTETLAGIPSIIFGLFGFLFFVNILGFGFGLFSGCLTLTLMILPTVVRTSEEALKSVPRSLREGSLALGATKLQTIGRVTIPAAAPGILTGLILGIGRAVGETAALLFTMGSDYKLAKGLFSSARVLSSHVYLLFAEGISFDRAFSTATVLIVIVLAFNFFAKRLVARMGAGAGAR
jgi:phosphate transport system permease protein